MKTVNLLACSLVISTFSFAGCAPEKVVLEPGKTQVVIPADAMKNVRFAAEEMTNFLSRVLGAPVKIVDAVTLERDPPGDAAVTLERDPPGDAAVTLERDPPVVGAFRRNARPVDAKSVRVNIYLGEGPWTRKAGLDLNSLKEDGYFIKTVPGGVIIAGVDDPEGDPHQAIKWGRGPQARRATVNGVYGFLERFAGCRFYFAGSGEMGEITPHAEKLVVEADLRDEPVYDYRDSSGPYGGTTWFPPWNGNFLPPRALNFYRLRVSGRGRPLVHGVRFMQLRRRFGKEHPDWFVGKSSQAARHDAQLCWSSAIRDEIAKDAIAFLKGEDAASRGYIREPKERCDAKGWPLGAFFPGMVCVDADDGYAPCPCAKCQAAYKAWTAKHSDASKGSALMWSAWKDIAEQVKRSGAKGRIFSLAYSCYKDLPDFELCDNQYVGCARGGGWALGAHERYNREMAEVKAWSEKTHGKTHLHNYSLNYRLPGIPSVSPLATARYYREVSPYACSVLNETTSDRYAHTYLNDYMMAKTTWNPAFDAAAALAEHHRLMFGAAAPEMAVLYSEMEDLWINRVQSGEEKMTPLGPVLIPPNPFEIWRSIYSEERIAKWTRLFDEGEKKLAAGSVEARRLKLMREQILDVLVKARQAFVGGIDAEAEEARRKREGVRNLLDKEYACEFYVPDAAAEKNHERATRQTQLVIPYTFDTNATYRLSCFLETKDVVKTAGGYLFNGANVALWTQRGWVWPAKTGATTGSTFGRVHQSIVFKGSIGFRPEENPKINICHGITLWLRGATGRMKVDGLILEKVK